MTEKKESHSKYVLRLVILSVAINGLLLIGTTLLDEVILRHHARTSQTLLYVHLISGLTLLYLSFLLVRRKTTALLLCIPVYAFILGVGITELTRYSSGHHFPVLTLLRSILFPLIVVGGFLTTEMTLRSKVI